MVMPVNMILVMYVILCILSYDFNKFTMLYIHVHISSSMTNKSGLTFFLSIKYLSVCLYDPGKNQAGLVSLLFTNLMNFFTTDIVSTCFVIVSWNPWGNLLSNCSNCPLPISSTSSTFTDGRAILPVTMLIILFGWSSEPKARYLIITHIQLCLKPLSVTHICTNAYFWSPLCE